MVFVADIAAQGAERVLYACDSAGVAVHRAADEYEDWATTRARERNPDAPHVAWLPPSSSAAATRARRLRHMPPEEAFAQGGVDVDERAGFRVRFHRLDDVAELGEAARDALIPA